MPHGRYPKAPRRRMFGYALLVVLGSLGPVAASMAQPATDAESALADPYRLADAVVPTGQSVDLLLDADQTRYTGRVIIQLEATTAAESFRFHAQEIEIGEMSLVGGDGDIDLSFEAGEADLIEVKTAQPLSPGDYVLTIDFAQEFDTQARGLYRLVTDGNGYLFTQFESTDARQAFPCWDEPSFKIPWKMTLTVPAQHEAFSNSPVASETDDDGWRRIEFKETPPMPSYLVALTTGPLETYPIEGMGVPGNVITVKGKSHMAVKAAECTAPLLKALEVYFGRPYPFEKLDLVAVPEFWPGAMENSGLITFRDTLLLLETEDATVSQLRSLARVNAHEIAHHWFGNLVTMEWWDDLWLNESFATWLGSKITDQVYPEYGLAVTSVQGTMGAMGTDALINTHPIRQKVMSTDNMLQMADGITYQKGAAVLGMFEEWMGEELFREGVIHYTNENAWKNATAGNLWSALGETAGFDVSAAMSTFTDQGGVPLVTATPLGDGKVEFTQQRFLFEGTQLPEGENPLWQIPVVYRYSDGNEARTQRMLLTESSQTVELPSSGAVEWIHPNAGERGYYRWETDAGMIAWMAENSTEIMDTRERTALVDQITALLDAGRLDGGSFLKDTGQMADDPAPEVVGAMLGSLATTQVAFVTDELQEPFALYVRRMLEPASERFGLVAQEGEPESVALLRPRLIAWLGKYGHSPEVIEYAAAVTQAYLEGTQEVDTSVLGACMQITAMDGGWKLYNAYKKGFETATVPRDRSRYLGAMGWFRDPAVVKAALHYTLNGDLRPQETFSIPMGVGSAPEFRQTMWDWMTKNYDKIMDKVPPMFAIYMPYFAGGCSADRIEAARVFFTEDGPHYVTGQEKELAKVEEAVTNCVGLREREGEAVARYLHELSGM